MVLMGDHNKQANNILESNIEHEIVITHRMKYKYTDTCIIGSTV